MSEPFTRIGKQILANGYHYADGADETAAEFIRKKLNGEWHPISALGHNGYVLGFSVRSDECTERGYFIGRLYDMRPNALINEWTGRWRQVDFWQPPTPPIINSVEG